MEKESYGMVFCFKLIREREREEEVVNELTVFFFFCASRGFVSFFLSTDFEFGTTCEQEEKMTPTTDA